jgi:tetratricopeptide (TPR) repeat protein
MWRYWRNGTGIAEGREWLDRVLSDPDLAPAASVGDRPAAASDDDRPAAPDGGGRRPHLLYAAAVLAGQQGDHEIGYRFAAESLSLATRAGDRAAEAQAHNALGISASSAGDYPLAADHFRQSLAITGDDDPRTPMALGNLANVSLRLGDVAAAEAYAERCLALERAAGNIHGIVLSLECLGQVRLARGDIPAARLALTEGLARSRELGDAFGEAMALHQLGDCAHADGDRAAALDLCTAALARRHELGDREDLAVSLDSVAELSAEDDPAFAARLLGAVDDLRERHRLAPAQDPARRAATERMLRAALGGPGYADAYRTGRATPLDLLVDEALDRAERGRSVSSRSWTPTIAPAIVGVQDLH